MLPRSDYRALARAADTAGPAAFACTRSIGGLLLLIRP